MSRNEKPTPGSIGDILSSSGTDRLYWVGKAMQWQGLYLIWTGLLELFGMDSDSRARKSLRKQLERGEINYKL